MRSSALRLLPPGAFRPLRAGQLPLPPARALRPLRTGALALAALACALAVAGCGVRQVPAAGSASSPAASGTPSAARSTAAAGPCPSAALKVSLNTAAAGVAAGTSLIPLQFTNVSATACTLPEYPGVVLASGSAGPDIGAPAIRQQSGQAAVLVLAPSGVAHAWLQVQSVANYPASSCKPVTARGIRVTLPPAAGAAFLTEAVQACARKPAGTSTLAVFPVQAGPARRGSAP